MECPHCFQLGLGQVLVSRHTYRTGVNASVSVEGDKLLDELGIRSYRGISMLRRGLLFVVEESTLLHRHAVCSFERSIDMV